MRLRLPLASQGLRRRLRAIVSIAALFLLFASVVEFIPGYAERTGLPSTTRSIMTLGMVIILLISLSGLVALEKMSGLIIRDALTGLFSQNYVRHRLEEEFYRAQRYNHPLSLLLVDIDNLKEVNNRFGRTAGDHLLKYFAQVILETVRPSDIPARYSGEEFLILLPETDRSEAGVVAERLRKKIAAHPFRIDVRSGDIDFTISVGVCTYPYSGENAEQLIALADLALDEAKKNGKNKVAVYNPH